MSTPSPPNALSSATYTFSLSGAAAKLASSRPAPPSIADPFAGAHLIEDVAGVTPDERVVARITVGGDREGARGTHDAIAACQERVVAAPAQQQDRIDPGERGVDVLVGVQIRPIGTDRERVFPRCTPERELIGTGAEVDGELDLRRPGRLGLRPGSERTTREIEREYVRPGSRP